MKKNNIGLLFCILIFGTVGIYLTFISGNTSRYDSETTASRMEVTEIEEYSDSATTTKYRPTYYFIVNGKEYVCESKASGSWPKENKNKIYYDSKNPDNCISEYEKSSSIFLGVIFLIATGLMIILTIKKPSNSVNKSNVDNVINAEQQEKINENIEKASEIIEKIAIIVKRIILGIIIIILIMLILFDTMLLKQTLISKDFVETTAEYVNRANEEDGNEFIDYIYTFDDKQGKKQEISITSKKETFPEDEIKIKYNENNPQDFYEEGSTLSTSGIIWYVAKIVILFLLIIVFFNKRLLNMFSITANRRWWKNNKKIWTFF